MTSLICSFISCGFITDCQRGRLLGHMCFSCYRTYVMILCNLLILWQNVLYLYLGRLRICFKYFKKSRFKIKCWNFQVCSRNQARVSFDKTHFTCIWVDLGCVLNISRNYVSRSNVEAFKSVQEIKQECKFIKAWQLVDSFSTPPICRGLRISEFNYDFLGIRESVYGPSFLLTLDI